MKIDFSKLIKIKINGTYQPPKKVDTIQATELENKEVKESGNNKSTGS